MFLEGLSIASQKVAVVGSLGVLIFMVFLPGAAAVLFSGGFLLSSLVRQRGFDDV